MTGYNNKYGAYMTKEDKKQELINKARRLNAEIEKYDDPTFSACRALYKEVIKIERLLTYEHGMDEEEIYIATN